jgi:hypothetical protein
MVRVYEPATGMNLAFAVVALCENSTTTNVSVVSVESGDDINVGPTFRSANDTFLIGMTTGTNTHILRYHSHSGIIQNSNTQTMILDTHMVNAETNTTNLIGQKIYFAMGPGSGESRTISAYTPATRTAVLDTPLSETTIAGLTVYSIGNLRTSEWGSCSGCFLIPSNEDVRFRTGERVFRLADTITGDLITSQTNGDATYFAQGLLQTKEETFISTRVPVIKRQTLNEDRTVILTNVQQTPTVHIGHTENRIDPLAETFYIEPKLYPNGVQLTRVRLMFKSKDPVMPVNIQIRPVVNGYPDAARVLPYADIMVPSRKVNVVTDEQMMERYANPELGSPLDDPSMYTEVEFDAPVTLQPGMEYALVVLANSIKYQVYISEIGKKLLGTERLISEQPYLGVLFKSQNASTWTPVQEQDLMFRLIRATYTQPQPMVCQFHVNPVHLPTANASYDAFYITNQYALLPNTSISFQYQATLETGDLTPFVPTELNDNVIFDDRLGRRMITTDPDSFKLRMYVSSSTPDISPLIDLDRVEGLFFRNILNNLELTNASIVIANTNDKFVNTANIVIAITGGGGSGADAAPLVSNNAISGFIMTSEGSEYTTSPTMTISGGGPLASANVTVIGEDQPAGGPAICRYITRKVALGDGFDAGDLRVFLTAYKPVDAEIYVYYKILSADDPASFESQPYRLMTPIIGYNQVSGGYNDFKEYTYAPGANYMPDNRVIYPGFGTFRYFAIKIVMASTDSTHPPRVKNFRAIALPALSPA